MLPGKNRGVEAIPGSIALFDSEVVMTEQTTRAVQHGKQRRTWEGVTAGISSLSIPVAESPKNELRIPTNVGSLVRAVPVGCRHSLGRLKVNSHLTHLLGAGVLGR